MKTKYYYDFNLKTRFQLRKWLKKNSLYPIIDVVNNIYGFLIKEFDSEKFQVCGLTYKLQ